MKKLVIAIDCDDVLVPSTERIVEMYNKLYGTKVKLEGSHEHDNPDWQENHDEVSRRIYDIQLQPEYTNTLPFEDAVSACRRMAKNHDLHLVTARPDIVMPVTMKMIDQYFPGIFHTIEHLGWHGDKGSICESIYADVLIDDNLKHLESARKCGISNLIWFGDYLWNKSDNKPAGVVRCSDWAAVEQEIERIARLKIEG